VALALLSSQGRVVAINYSTGGLYQYGRESLVDTILPVHELLMPTRMRISFEEFIEVIGAEAVAGRETLVMDWFVTEPEDAGPDDHDPDRFFIKAVSGAYTTGVILRRVVRPENPGLLEKEVIVGKSNSTCPSPTSYSIPVASAIARNGGATPAADPGQTPIPADRYLTISICPAAAFNSVDKPGRTRPFPTDRADYLATAITWATSTSVIRQPVLPAPPDETVVYTEWFENHPTGPLLRWFSLESLYKVTNRCPTDPGTSPFPRQPTPGLIRLYPLITGLRDSHPRPGNGPLPAAGRDGLRRQPGVETRWRTAGLPRRQKSQRGNQPVGDGRKQWGDHLQWTACP
jgi:hypothetical protein